MSVLTGAERQNRMDWFEVEELQLARGRGPAPEPLAEQLKALFQAMTVSPMPDRLTDLADRLDEAFQRGDLRTSACRKRPS